MVEVKRNALLKEFSRKLSEQVAFQSSEVVSALPEASGSIRSEARKKSNNIYQGQGSRDVRRGT